MKKLIGSKTIRDLKKLQKYIIPIDEKEKEYSRLSDDELKKISLSLKERGKAGESLDSLLIEAFALVKEASKRTIGLRPFDVQVIGGIILHQGKIAEMKTGEGKTLVATLPAYLNALSGKGVHIITVNDYLAKRDSEWMGEVFRFLGLTVGCIQLDNKIDPELRREQYKCDITYGTNSSFGFDYLRDNMEVSLERCVQRGHFYAIIDEVDSILVDEARTPLIISGPAEESTELYYEMNYIAKNMKEEEDFTVDEKAKTIALTEKGNAILEKKYGEKIYTPDGLQFQHHILQALKAHRLFKKDVNYVIKENKIIIVDEFTGRLMPGRRYSDGLHQALEAKENVKIENANQTLATITIQNYFRMYEKLAGMTGTAKTEESEFVQIYNLEVSEIPTNRPLIRKNFDDEIYKTEDDKFNAVLNEIVNMHKIGRPVLVGTVSIEKSERLSGKLGKKKIPYNVLNAKNHEKEAQIIADAGQEGAVTISTNMAGRGTDIVLGRGIAERGGLHIIGTERHESRRIDNQLRGRSGRQGDPGSSKFFLSLEDDLLRIFASEKIAGLTDRIYLEDGVPIKHKIVTNIIEKAQKMVESRHFEIRKNTLEYDDVMNKQREVIYAKRREILEGELEKNDIVEMIDEIIEDIADNYIPANKDFDDWDYDSLGISIKESFNFLPDILKNTDSSESREDLLEKLKKEIYEYYEEKEAIIMPERMRNVEKFFFLQYIDIFWKEHLYTMDQVREGIGLRGYGQRDPLLEYKKEAFYYFDDLIGRIKKRTIRSIFSIKTEIDEEDIQIKRKRGASREHRGEGKRIPVQSRAKKIGRNDPCNCGSGKKYKNCCGRN